MVVQESAVTDFCHSRPTLDGIYRQVALMDAMMQRVQADRAVAATIDSGSAWFEARVKCLACRSGQQCLEWPPHAQAGPPSEPPGFCPNAAFFRRCRQGLPIDRLAPFPSASVRP